MAIIDSYRTTLLSKQKDLSKLTSDKAKEQMKISDLNKKINTASEALRKTSSQSTISSKLREIDRYNKDIVTVTKKISDLENKIANKNKEIIDYQGRIDKEQSVIDKKRMAESSKMMQEQQKNLRDITSTLNHHKKLHLNTQLQISDLKKLPEKIVVLFLASNPIDQPQLRLDEEVRAISEMIKKATHRDSIKLESCWAVRPIDILQALNEHQPTIVHFSGHGSSIDEIIFQTDEGNSKAVSKDALVQTMIASSDGIRLVFFNTCHSKNHANAVSEFVEATIGMNTTIGDNAARVFSSQFYSSISFGYSVEKSFQQAKALLMLEGINEENTPELFIKEGLNADDIFLVRQPEY